MPDLTELNNKQNTYYQKRNHVKRAKNQASKTYIDPTLGTSDGGGGPVLPVVPTAQWDATDLPLGPLSQWADGLQNRLVSDTANGLDMVVVDGLRGRGVQFDASNYNSGVGPYPSFNVQNNGNPSGITGGTLLMLFEMTNTWESNYKSVMGNSGAPDRVNGARLDAGQARARGGASSLPVRFIFNDLVTTNGTPTWALIGISGPSELYLIGVRNLNLLMNRMGMQSTTVGNSGLLNGIIHEVIWYDYELDDATYDDAAQYLRDKWPLVETGGPPFSANLTNHYDAGQGVTLSGSNVIGWADQSGNGRDATFVSGTAPTQDGAFSNAIYGLDTSNNTVGLDVGGTLPATQEIKTVVACLFWHTGATNGSGSYTSYQDLMGGTTLVESTGDPEDDARFTTFANNPRWNSSFTNQIRHDDRAPVATNTNTPNEVIAVADGLPHVMSWTGGIRGVSGTYLPRLFNRGPGLTQDRGFRGGFYEVLAYDFELTDAQLDEAHDYLYAKWGVTPAT